MRNACNARDVLDGRLTKDSLRGAGLRNSIRLALVIVKHGRLFSSQAFSIDLSLKQRAGSSQCLR
jgi:hypothetical protein